MKKFLLLFLSVSLLLGFNLNAQLTGASVNAVTNITHDGVTLNGEITTSGAIDVDYYFNYGTTSGSLTTQAPDPAITLSGLNGTQAVDETLTGLTAETQYFYELYAEETIDDTQTATSTEGSFYTYSEIYASAIADFVTGTTTNESIQLNWTASNSTTTDGYLILYAEGSNPPDPNDPGVNIEKGVLPSNQAYANKVVVTSDATETVVVTGLNAGTEYSFTIIPYNNDAAETEATTNYNLTTYSTVSAYTLAGEPTTDPTNPARDIPDVTEMSISYDEVADADGYLILYATGNTAPNTTGVVDGTKSLDGSEFTDADGYLYVQGAASTNPTITGLTEATEYSFRIIAFAHSADEPSTYNYRTPGIELLSAYTLANQTNSAITGITKEGATTTSIDLSFDDYTFPAGGDGFYVAYYQAGSTGPDLTDLENGFQPSDQPTLSVEYDIENTDNTYEITANNSLTAGTQYAFRIVPGNFINNVSTCHYRVTDAITSTFWTLQTQPSDDISSLNFESKTDGSITLSYDQSTGANGYLILYRTGNNDPDGSGVTDGVVHSDAADFGQATGFQYVDGGTTLQTEITGLDPKTEYSFRIIPYSYATDGGIPVPETYNYNTASNTKREGVFTSATFPPDPVSSFEKISSTSTSITFNWADYTVVSSFSDNGGFLLYYEEYTNADPIDLSTIENGIAPGSQTGLVDFVEVTTNNETETTITGLNTGTRYKFTIIPYNKDGSNNETIGYNITGKPDINHYTLAAPADGGADIEAANFELTNITNSDLDVNWATVTDADGYLVLYTKSNSALDDSFLTDGLIPDNQLYPAEIDYIDVTDGIATSVNVAGLDPDTDYAFKVIPYTYVNDGGPVEETYNYNNNNPPLETATTLCVDPTETVADLTTSNVAVNQMDISWTNSSSLNVLAVARLSSTAKTGPTDGQDYTANNDFSSANEIGTSGNFIVYENNGTSFTLSGLEDYQEYTIDVYLFNDNGFCYEDNGVSITERTDCDPATTTVSGTSTSAVSFDEVTVNWTIEGAGNNVLVVAREDTDAAVAPTSNTDYAEDPIFGDGQTTGTGNFTVYDGSGTSVTVTGLNELTGYNFDIYEYNPNNGGFCYNTTAVTESATTLCEPPSTASTFNAATNLTAGSVDLNWNAATGADAYLIVAKQGPTVDLTVNNGDDFTADANSSFVDAAVISNDNKIVFSAAGTSTTITGLTAATEYTFEIYAYVNGSFCYAFGPDAQTITTLAASSSNTLSLNSAATSISSVDNDENSNYITVMDFDMTDVGGDGIETKLASFAFSPGTGNDFPDWTDIIYDAKVVNVTNSNEVAAASITAGEIGFTIGGSDNNGSGKFGYIDDNSSVNMQLQIRLKADITVPDIEGKNFVFEFDPSTIATQGNSSGFNTTAGSEIITLATDNEIEVIATAFEFTANPPTTVNAGVDIAQQAIVEAKDANGNLDLDYNGNFTITNTDNIPMQNLPTTFTNAELQFPTTFNYQGSGDGTLTITDDDNSFNASSTAVTVNPTVDLTELTNGLNSGTLQSGTIDQAVLGFEIEALGSTQLTSIEFTTDADISGLVDNLRLVASIDNTYDGTGTDLPIASTPTIVGGNSITFSSLTENFSSEAKNYFLVLNVDENVNVDTPALTFELNIEDIVFTNSANKNASAFSKPYDFEDVTKPEIDQITATPTVLSGADLGTDALEIQVTFNEEMDPDILFTPNISFPVEDPTNNGTLTGPNLNSGWSAGNTIYTFYFDLADNDELIEDIDVSISNARDKYGNALDPYTEQDLFTIDTENPIATNISLDRTLVNRPESTIELTVTFDKEMNDGIDPSFTVDNSANLISNGDGVWSEAVPGEGNKVYTVTFTHDLGVEEDITDKIIIEDAEDLAGNIMDPNETNNFSINTTQPRIQFITATNSNGIYKEGDIIKIQVNFDQDITVSNGTPELELNSTGTAVFSSATNNILTFDYEVLDGENAALLDVTAFNLEGANITNAADNEAIVDLPIDPNDELSTQKSIEIDTRSPEVSNITLDLTTVSQTETTLEVLVEYDENMDQSSNPSFNFSAGNNMVLTGSAWSDAQTYRAEFEHDLAVEEELDNVTIEVSGATDVVGNTAVTDNSDPFNIDTQSPRITEIVTTTADGTYGPGEQINIRVVFDEAIQQTGAAPTLTLNTGANAVFENITGVNQDQLNFTYTIGAVNSNENTLDLDVTSISTSENEVLDLVDNPSVLALPATPNRLIDNADIVIDTRPAEVTNVSSTNIDGKYKAGNIIGITVTFDETVTVTGNPRIALNTGDYAEYASGSNSTELTFNYTVQNSDGITLFDVTDLEYKDVNSLELNGGSIIDPASVPVDQTLPTIGSGNSLGDNKDIEIDTRSPEFTIDLDISMVDLNDLTLTVTTQYDEDMDTNSDPSYSFNMPNSLVQDNVGNWTDNRTYVETFTHNENEEELSNVEIEISGATDEVGNTAVNNTSDPFDIDTQKPRITEITSTASGIYGPGDAIDIKVVFDEDVQKMGTDPSLNLNSTGVASFVNITNGNEVNFTYTVGAVNSGENTADLTVDTFSPSENEVLDLQENPSVLDLPGANNLGDNANIIIDTDPANITNVTASPTTGVFKAGDVIDIIVTFNETVVVDQTGGIPRLLLNTGSYATYSSGSNTDELTFTYTVASAGGSIVDVLELEYANINSLELNGGSIVDLANVTADLVLPATNGAGSLSDNTDIEIDTTSPTVAIGLDNTEITRADNQLILTATYNEDMDQGTTPNFNVQGSNDLILDNGSWNSATEYIATFTHNLTEEEVQNVDIEVSGGTDVVGNTSVTNTSGTFTIDTQRPRILEIVSTSADGLYSPGDNINIQLVFDEDVTVGGTPLLDLNSGGQASFQSVTNGNEVNFVYTVGGVNSGENTLDLDVDAFDMNGGNIRDLVSNEADIVLPVNPDRLQDNSDIQVDSDPADIANVTATPDQGFFTTGDQIDITIEFDEPVVVTGTPLLALNSGSNAEYVSGSNSTVLTFNYTVEASDGGTIVDVADLEYASANSIDLNGGTIEDLAGINASLGLPTVGSANSLSGNTDITIDTQDPELANNPFTPFNGEFNVSHALTFTIELNEPVSGQGTNNISIIDKQTTNVLAVLDAGTAFTNNTSTTLEFDSFENLLEDSTEYYIQFAPGALVDRAGNEFAGFTADNVWSFTTFGPARIDDFSIGACVGEVFTIQGQYFTGVSRIRTNINGDTPFTISTFTVVDDETIEFTVPSGTVPGTITLDKQTGQAGNTEDASTTSDEPIKVGPSSAQLVLVDPNDDAICDIDDLGNVNEVDFTVDIVGGNGVYTLVYQINANDPVTITGYEEGQTFSIVPPDSAENNVTIVSLTDEDPDLNTCSAPDLGTDIEVVKYIRSRVDAGGFESQEEEFGVIELCGANTSIVDFSDASLVTNSPEISGTVQQGTWTIDEGPSSNGGGFSPDFTLKSVQTDRPDTVKYYASFADGVRGEIVLELTSDDPGGLNPCVGTSDFVTIRFVESISVNSDRNVAICLDEDENGNQIAIADLESTVSGGSATDSLSVEWSRVDDFNEEAGHDGTWGFKDDENQATYSLTSNVLNPIYKASPQEVLEGRSTLEVLPVLVSGVGCGAIPAPREVDIRINDIPEPTKSSGPEIVCAGDQEVRFRMNTSSPGNTFQWSFTNGLNEFDGATNSNLVFVNFREVATETTDTLVVQELNPNTGCISKPDTFFISLKPLPIANIKYNSTTTISNTAALIPLEGEGGTAGNLVDATSENGQFSGRGVIQNSNGDYFLDSSQLGVTDITDEEDVHEVFFTFTNEFGCTATDTIAFNVFDAERIFPALAEDYCQSDAADTISVDNAIVPDGFVVSAINGPGITEIGYTDVVVGNDTISVLRAVFDPGTAYANNPDTENPSVISITYSIEDPNNAANNAANVGEQIVVVNPLPELEIDDIEASICTYDERIEFEPIGITGNNYSFELINEGLPDSLVIGDSIEGFEFDPAPLLEYLADNEKDSIKILVRYTYQDGNSCEDSRVYDFVVWRQPSKPVVNSTDLCFVNGVMDTARVVNYFGDRANEELLWYSGNDFTAEPIHQGKSYIPTPDFFTTVDEIKFNVIRRNVDSEGEADPSCISNATEVTFRKIDNPDFEWNKSTFGDAPIVFTGEPNQASLESTEWTITKMDGEQEELLSEDAFTKINDSTLAVDFNSYGAGRYKVKFTVSTEKSCSAEVIKEIVILPEATVAESYIYSFDNSTEGWVSTGFKRNSTDTDKRLWDFAIPSGESNFESNESVWITNAEGSYESNIVSYVYSPSMDIRGIDRPVVSFDLWINMAEEDDGLILEYSSDGKTIEDPEKTWEVLGNFSGDASSGLEWYNTDQIEALVGTNKNPTGFGWSFENDAESINAVNAKHALEEIPMEGRDSLIFRFQFKSTTSENQFGNRDGAAFDNFRVESLNRNVLVEYFGDFESANDSLEMKTIDSVFNEVGNFAWINYRINENDPLYRQESSSMLSRIYYYDAYNLEDQFAIDGEITEFSFSGEDGDGEFGRIELSRARLFSSISTIDLDVSLINEDQLGIDVSFQSVEEVGENVNLYIAVLQKEIKGGEQGTAEGVTYYNVLRKLLPTNSGIEVSGTSGQQTVNFKASRPSDENPLAVVAFLQNTVTGAVIQSAYLEDVPLLSMENVTSVEKELSALDIKLFPNPAHDNLNIQWDIPLQEEAKAKVIDVTGKIIKEFRLERGDRYYELNTSSLKTGMYNLIFTNQKGEHKMMKFAVTN